MNFLVLDYDGALRLISAGLELLASVEDADDLLIPEEVAMEARRMRSVCDEWIERVEVPL